MQAGFGLGRAHQILSFRYCDHLYRGAVRKMFCEVLRLGSPRFDNLTTVVHAEDAEREGVRWRWSRRAGLGSNGFTRSAAAYYHEACDCSGDHHTKRNTQYVSLSIPRRWNFVDGL